jgi:glyoxylase-like metal-dependent hydrolase (beta-lactamase superfamily II)
MKARLSFHKIVDWPKGAGQIDLGGRTIDVIPTPGTHKDGVTFYDSYTRLLFTGDLLYAGRIEIANDRDYVASLGRLQQWKATHPVKWVMGGHITMTFAPGRAYFRFATYRTFEHVLQLEPEAIDEALEHAKEVVGKQAVVVRTDFILLNRVGPDEQAYETPKNMPYVPVPMWFS